MTNSPVMRINSSNRSRSTRMTWEGATKGVGLCAGSAAGRERLIKLTRDVTDCLRIEIDKYVAAEYEIHIPYVCRERRVSVLRQVEICEVNPSTDPLCQFEASARAAKILTHGMRRIPAQRPRAVDGRASAG